jgi:CheY-like chemotaxis protein
VKIKKVMRPAKIAVVDDDDLIRATVCDMVREICPGAQVVEYRSATRAMHEVETGTVDLLVTNCHMPDMDGATLVRKLREQKHALPIIMISGSDGARELGEAAGIDRFVPKNLLHPGLAEAINALLVST